MCIHTIIIEGIYYGPFGYCSMAHNGKLEIYCEPKQREDWARLHHVELLNFAFQELLIMQESASRAGIPLEVIIYLSSSSLIKYESKLV